MKYNNQVKLSYFLALSMITALTCHDGFANGGIVTDGTVGGVNALHHIQTLKPDNHMNIYIPEDLGTRHGGNLFHSFKDFNIQAQQAVTFQENKLMSTNNVITRVTGTSGSDINGTLNVTPEGKANFYLINPNGVTFGRDAQVNVPGSVHVSTADEIKLKDGRIFSAIHPTEGSLLSSAAPTAFGFLGTSTKNNGLLKIDSASLNINPGKAFDVVTGRIQFTGDSPFIFPTNIISVNQGGEVRLIAIHGAADISLKTENNGLSLPKLRPSNLNAGKIEFNKAPIEITGNGAGKLSIWGGDVIFSNTSSITLVNNGAINPGSGKGITIKANSLALLNGSNISSITSVGSVGKSADIAINTIKNFDINNSVLSTKSAGKNNSGDIAIQTGRDLIVQGRAGKISTEMQVGSRSKGGDIKIYARGDIKIINDGRIGVPFGSSSSSNFQGRIGNIRIKAEGNVILSGDLAGIFSVTTSKAKAGDIEINVKGNLSLLNGSEINSGTRASGDSGNIMIVAKNIYMKNSSIHAESQNKNAGNPGNIKIAGTENLSLNQARISIQNKSVRADGIATSRPNTLTISAPNIRLNRSQITTQSSGNQPAGSIALMPTNKLSLESSAISTESQEGNGGDLTINRGQLIGVKNSRLVTTVKGRQGNGGNINVNADNLVMSTGLIQANTAAQHAKGGNITLNLNSLITSGNQLITGGSKPIEWQPGKFGLNVIQAAAPNGLSGSIRITAPALNLSGTLANLGNPQFDTSALNWENCFSDSTSSLIRIGKGGIPLKARDSWVY